MAYLEAAHTILTTLEREVRASPAAYKGSKEEVVARLLDRPEEDSEEEEEEEAVAPPPPSNGKGKAKVGASPGPVKTITKGKKAAATTK